MGCDTEIRCDNQRGGRRLHVTLVSVSVQSWVYRTRTRLGKKEKWESRTDDYSPIDYIVQSHTHTQTSLLFVSICSWFLFAFFFFFLVSVEEEKNRDEGVAWVPFICARCGAVIRHAIDRSGDESAAKMKREKHKNATWNHLFFLPLCAYCSFSLYAS